MTTRPTDDHEYPNERSCPFDWDTPHRPRPDAAWYHPRVLAWLLVDIPYILREYGWHKWQSLRANRSSVHFTLATLANELDILDQDDLTREQQRRVKTAKRKLRNASRELNMESRYIKRHIDEDDR